ncbi:MAG TPA: integrase arm-type DNA-binding domain-containing protein [Alphaproteobacteria bacterium]|nr:integrase arm-type DNA-binding domain-containing protein [Alphaproteobacteria bacterium]
MDHKVITDRTLKALKPALAGKRFYVWDALVPSFGVRVTDRGRITFMVMRRVRGRLLRRFLGTYPAIGLEAARREARRAIENMQRGIDPKEESERGLRDAAVQRKNTFAAIAADYLAEWVKDLRSGADVRSNFARELLPRFGARPITDITRREIVEFVREVNKRGTPYAARHLLKNIRGLYNWAIAQEIYGIESSPCDRIKIDALVGPEEERDRTLTHEEIRRLWKATERVGYPFGTMTRLLLLTGQRLSEVAEASWREFDLERALWTIPAERMKADAAHLVPIPPEALALLQSLPRWSEGDFLLSTTGGARPCSAFSRAKDILDRCITEDLLAELPEPRAPTITLAGSSRKVGKQIQLSSRGHAPFAAATAGQILAVRHKDRWGYIRLTEVGAPDKATGRIVGTLEAIAPSTHWLLGPAPWRFHDLRRTVRTEFSGIPSEDIVRELVIGHTMSQLHRIYDLYAYLEEKRQLLTLWEVKLKGILQPSSGENIVEFKPRMPA